ncbi:TRI59 protein, partial [Smithornis capensis]|nr:TRI59 protein [Smithornis capensis]
MDRLEEELTCAVCYSIYEDPRVLPCSHTFCRDCLEELLQQSNSFSIRRCLNCPNCRAVVEVPGAGVESLPINIALKAVIEKCQQEEPLDIQTCREHPRQPLNIYCVLDKKLVCGQCLTIGKHNGHPIDDLRSAYRKAKEAAGKLQEQLSVKYWREVLLCYVKLGMQKSKCQSLMHSQRDVVEQYFKELGDTLEHKKQALLSALDDLESCYLEEYEPLLEDVSKVKAEKIELKHLNSSIQTERSPLMCLEKLDELQERIKALKQKELPTVKLLEIYPRMEYLLKEEWSKTELGQIHKILPPKLKLIPRRKLCSKCPGKEDRESKEQLWTLNLPTILLLFLFPAGGIVGAVLSLHKALSCAVIQAAPAYIWEFLLHVYQDSGTLVQEAMDGLCHTFASVMEFCRSFVPL